LVSSQVMLSPRNSMILTRRVYLDPSVPPSPPNEHNAPIPRNSGVSSQLDSETRLKTLSKQMNRYAEIKFSYCTCAILGEFFVLVEKQLCLPY
jgi:hypothetical protein